jgi:uncharacterized protein DUF3363
VQLVSGKHAMVGRSREFTLVPWRQGRKLAQEHGGSFCVARSGERINATCGQCVQLLSGEYPLVERSREFSLVWRRPVIEKELGR